MLIIKNCYSLDGTVCDHQINDNLVEETIVDATSLTLLPAVIDPHVHFRTPGLQNKEDWQTAARAAIRGGCTLVFDMPNTLPPTITYQLLQEKKTLIDQQLIISKIPLRYELFFGADKNHFAEIAGISKLAIGIKVFMGCSTGNLVIDTDEDLAKIFALAAEHDMLVAVHAEDERSLSLNKQKYVQATDYATHSLIRDIDVATTALTKALELTRTYNTRLYVLHVSTKNEIDLIAQAKADGVCVFAETTPHHLFLDTEFYSILGGKAVVNPPLRNKNHHAALFSAIHAGIIDTIGSDHAPHTAQEKLLPFGQCPSGMPGIEFTLPLLLTAYHQNLLSLEQIVELTSARARKIFNLPDYHDYVLVDLTKRFVVKHTYSKCGWTPYLGFCLQGLPIYTILRGKIYKCEA